MTAVLPRVRRGAVFAGAFLGPFGGGVTAAMLPELGADYAVSTATASASITAYLVPFAGMMLFSGTLGERWGRRRTVITGYAVYVAASALCVLAPSWELFLGGRALQGAANAFTTPLLLAVLAGSVAPDRLGRSLGWFGSLQAAGQTFAPLVGGLAAELHWQLAFVGVGAVAAGLGLAGLPDGAASPGASRVHNAPEDRSPGASRVHNGPGNRTPDASRVHNAGQDAPVGASRVHNAGRDAGRGGTPAPSLRTALRPDVLRAGGAAALGWGCLAGLNFLLALRLEDAFGLGSGARGLVLTALGVTGILTARLIGGAVDRIGARRCVLAGALSGAVLLAGIGLVPVLAVVVALWALAGVSSQLVLVGVNALVLGAGGANTGGAVSVVQAIRFGGGATAPVVVPPVYHADPVAGFLAPAALLAVGVPVLLAGRRSIDRSGPARR